MRAPNPVRFYLGTHQPSWLTQLTDVPLFVAHRRLMPRVTLKPASTTWAVDSGGFNELKTYGEWKINPIAYVEAVDRYQREIGSLEWAAPQDWMCEPYILRRTGLSVREHQERTVENFLMLRRLWAEHVGRPSPFIPVLQGWTLEDYWRCVDLYADADVRLADYPLVGIGTVCKRQATTEIGTIVRSLGCVLPLHGFGVKIEGLARYGRWLASADSLAWSLAGRHTKPGCSPTHQSEANCLPYAVQWRQRVLKSAAEPPRQQAGLFTITRNLDHLDGAA